MESIVFSAIIFIVTMILCIIGYRSSKSTTEKIIYLLLLSIVIVPIIIFNLDFYNIPTQINWTSRISSQAWLSFIATYIATIFGATIGAIALIIITKRQMDKTFDFQEKERKESKRIEIMPCLDYKIDVNKNSDGDLCPWYNVNCKNTDRSIDILIDIEFVNLGLGNVRNLSYEFEGYKLKKVGNIYVAPLLKKEASINQTLFLLFNKDEFDPNRYIQHQKNYKIKLHIYYQDMLYNSYHQLVNFEVSIAFINHEKSDFIKIARIIDIMSEEQITCIPGKNN